MFRRWLLTGNGTLSGKELLHLSHLGGCEAFLGLKVYTGLCTVPGASPPPNIKAIALRSADQNTTSLNSFSFNTPASQSTVMGLPDGALLDALYNV
jgi:hypothetical protein